MNNSGRKYDTIDRPESKLKYREGDVLIYYRSVRDGSDLLLKIIDVSKSQDGKWYYRLTDPVSKANPWWDQAVVIDNHIQIKLYKKNLEFLKKL